MKTKLINIVLGLTAMLSSCTEDHIYYNTAAKAEIVQGAEKYEVGEAIVFANNITPSNGTTIKSYFWEFGDADNSTSTEKILPLHITKMVRILLN